MHLPKLTLSASFQQRSEEILDAAIHNKYSRDPDKLRPWKSASHTERAAKKQKPDDTTPPPAV